MKAILSERNLVIVLFVMVFITFSLAHEDSKKMEKVYTGLNTSALSHLNFTGKQQQTSQPDHGPFDTE